MYFDYHWKFQNVNDNMSLSYFDSPVSIYTPIRINVTGDFKASRVYNAQTWTLLLTNKFPYHEMQYTQKFLPYSFKFPFAEIVINRLPRRKVRREHPLLSISDGTEYTIHYFTKRTFSTFLCGSTIFLITCHCFSVRLVGNGS